MKFKYILINVNFCYFIFYFNHINYINYKGPYIQYKMGAQFLKNIVYKIEIKKDMENVIIYLGNT